MIANFKHKGLKAFFENGTLRGIQADHQKRLSNILAILDEMETVVEMNLPCYGFHKLKGDLKEFYSVSVSGNWRIIFKFFDGNVYDVDYKDYH